MDISLSEQRALWRRWAQGMAGGILALDTLLSLQWGPTQLFGPRPLAPIQNLILGVPEQTSLASWLATSVLVGLLMLHGFLALAESRERPPLTERPGFGRKPRLAWLRVYQQVQVTTGVLLVPLVMLYVYTLFQSPPNLDAGSWDQRLTSLGSRMLYVMLVPVLLLHALLGLGRLICRWFPGNAQGLFHRRWSLALGSASLVLMVASVLSVVRSVPAPLS
ncbi:hypothetical protein [Ferrimonas balearica]|uniref:hypothetical protein n=1 Tax=Ferrimonas balearica TaxID=44012 RepID=UPI001C99BB54|nr:hypothetical protein [Ferrimonas balearica]MBY5992237.1 hypothetical protein [Ferrimonas balearica]